MACVVSAVAEIEWRVVGKSSALACHAEAQPIA